VAEPRPTTRLMEKLRVSMTRQWRAGVVRREPTDEPASKKVKGRADIR
jgi:hypothetical protein